MLEIDREKWRKMDSRGEGKIEGDGGSNRKLTV